MQNMLPVAPDAVIDGEADVTPEPTARKPFQGLPRNPADPTVAGSIALAFQMLARQAGSR
jgi:hypothetical protein